MKIRVEIEESIKIKKSKSEPFIKFRLFNMDTYLPIDLTGAKIEFIMEGAEEKTKTRKFKAPAGVVVSGMTGIGRYDFSTEDIEIPGNYYGKFEITFVNGDKIKVPVDREFIKIVVEDG